MTRLDLSWSCVSADKLYVQHRMVKHAATFWQWPESRARLCFCGDAARMAKDMDAALHTILERAEKRTAEQATACLQKLAADRRYGRDFDEPRCR